MSPPALFIASLGNPGAAYALTRHSAAHVVLSALAGELNAAFDRGSDGALRASEQVTWTPTADKAAKKKRKRVEAAVAPLGAPAGDATTCTAVTCPSPRRSEPPPPPPPPPRLPTASWTLWQSPTLMNISGPALRTAWHQHQRMCNGGGGMTATTRPRLVILHDSLEHQPGTIAVRANAGSLSAKGHNGIRSVLEALAPSPGFQRGRKARREKRDGGGGSGTGRNAPKGDEGGEEDDDENGWTKISIGIGRPESRHADDVSRHVLGKMTEREVSLLRNKTMRLVMETLKKVT